MPYLCAVGIASYVPYSVKAVLVCSNEPRRFSTWCPKAIALIGKLPPTLHDRAIEIPIGPQDSR